MNRLSLEKRVLILNMLVEGSSMRAISRVADVSVNTVGKLLADAGDVCAKYHDEKVRNVDVRRVECDEVWSFCYAKQKTVNEAPDMPEGAGDVWTWTAIDADTKLMLAYEIGDRSLETGWSFWKTCASGWPPRSIWLRTATTSICPRSSRSLARRRPSTYFAQRARPRPT